VDAYERAQAAQNAGRDGRPSSSHPSLPREALNPEHLTDPVVWMALLEQGMPMTALLRNLATLSRIGLLKPMSDAERIVLEQLGDEERLRKARVHPLAVLVALKTYEQGYSDRSGQTWDAAPRVVDALDAAFYAAFGNVEPTGKRTMLALDVSGSMGFSQIAGMPGITPRVGSAAMALVTAATEPQHMFTAFATQFVGLTISPRQRLDDVIAQISGLPFGGTDCSLPMLAAEQNDIDIDTFAIYTDSETWAGHIHPSQALERYRQKTGIPAKLVVVGMVSNGFSIADPNDPECSTSSASTRRRRR
jgi:60 kDa SS-A/Ro ribonucleoprotein